MEKFEVELENLTDKEKKTFLHLVKKRKIPFIETEKLYDCLEV